jgi:hypothetical protein
MREFSWLRFCLHYDAELFVPYSVPLQYKDHMQANDRTIDQKQEQREHVYRRMVLLLR